MSCEAAKARAVEEWILALSAVETDPSGGLVLNARVRRHLERAANALIEGQRAGKESEPTKG